MAPIRKHGGHRIVLSVPAAAAGSAADTIGAIYQYDAYSVGQSVATGTVGLDQATELISECVVTTYAALTGQATNFASLRLTQYSAAGAAKNGVQVTFSAAGVVTVAFVPMNFYVASGATVPGSGTGTLTVNTGNSLVQGWILATGDSIVLDRVSNNATGLATPAFSCTFLVGVRGA